MHSIPRFAVGAARCGSPARTGRAARARAWLLPALLLAAIVTAGAAEAAERRRDPYPTELGYLIVPAPYSLPGIGTGWVVFGYGANVLDTHADAYLYWITGDAKGLGAGVEEVHLLPKRLLASVWREDISTAQVQQYQTRGMATDEDEFVYVDVSDVRSVGTELRLTFDQRRYEVFVQHSTQDVLLERLRDKDGNITQTFAEPVSYDTEETSVGVRLDFTDDYYDPHDGTRAVFWRTDSPPQEDDDPDYYTLNAAVDYYLPVGRQSTWVFDYFRSQAVVQRQGTTDPTQVALDYCPTLDPGCVAESEGLINDALAANAHGTARSLGGRDRLRSYPDGRFSGAYTEFVGTELRWNLTQEATPFDYGIWRDVRTGFQIAFFAASGTVAESAGALWDEHRESYGVGFRVVTVSGGVYRFDLATGDEGSETTIIVNYPW